MKFRLMRPTEFRILLILSQKLTNKPWKIWTEFAFSKILDIRWKVGLVEQADGCVSSENNTATKSYQWSIEKNQNKFSENNSRQARSITLGIEKKQPPKFMPNWISKV